MPIYCIYYVYVYQTCFLSATNHLKIPSYPFKVHRMRFCPSPQPDATCSNCRWSSSRRARNLDPCQVQPAAVGEAANNFNKFAARRFCSVLFWFCDCNLATLAAWQRMRILFTWFLCKFLFYLLRKMRKQQLQQQQRQQRQQQQASTIHFEKKRNNNKKLLWLVVRLVEGASLPRAPVTIYSWRFFVAKLVNLHVEQWSMFC